MVRGPRRKDMGKEKRKEKVREGGKAGKVMGAGDEGERGVLIEVMGRQRNR